MADSKSQIAVWIDNIDAKNFKEDDTKERIVAALESAGLDASAINDFDERMLFTVLAETELALRTRTTLVAKKGDLATVIGDNLQTVSAIATGAGVWYWPFAMLSSAVITLLPILLITLTENDLDDDPNNKDQFKRSFTLGLFLFILTLAAGPTSSMFFATDVIQERSYGSNHKENMVITMTNSAIVGALLLTMVVAAMQADNPSEIGSFLSQGYQVILVISCYYSVNATATSVMCMTYLQPIEGDAAENFLALEALYFGEPIAGICMSLVFFMDAMAIWVWGTYGSSAGTFTTLVVWFFIVRSIVVLLNLSAWENPEVDAAERTRRMQVIKQSELGAEEMANPNVS